MSTRATTVSLFFLTWPLQAMCVVFQNINTIQYTKKKLFDSDNFPVEGSLPGRPRDVHEQQHRALQDSSLRQRGWIHFHLDESLTKIWKQFDQNWETFLLKPGENLIKIRRKLDQNQVIIQPGDNGSGDLGLLDVCHLLQCLCSSPSSSAGEIDHHD